MLIGLLVVASLGACLEKVTGKPVALDARFTVQSTGMLGPDDTGTPGPDDTGRSGHAEITHEEIEHVEVLPPTPFEGYEGERVLVSGLIVGDESVVVDLDVARVDETAESGLVSEGKLLFSGPGEFELSVPESVGLLKLSAFQDLDDDGPSLTDPYAELAIDVGTDAVTDLMLELVVGARERTSGGPGHGDAVHVDAPPGFVSGQAPSAGEQPLDTDPFEGVEGERVAVSGGLVYGGEGVVDVDLFKANASAPGGRILLGKLKRRPGVFSFQVPISVGVLELDAFADLTSDGPSGDDPRASVRGIDLTAGSVTGLELKLIALSDAPQNKPVDAGGTDIEEEFARTGGGSQESTLDADGL